MEERPIPSLYATLDECCTAEYVPLEYVWKGGYDACMGITNPPSSNPTTAEPSKGPTTNEPSAITLPPATSEPTTAKPKTVEPTVKLSSEPTQSPQPCLYYNVSRA